MPIKKMIMHLSHQAQGGIDEVFRTHSLKLDFYGILDYMTWIEVNYMHHMSFLIQYYDITIMSQLIHCLRDFIDIL